MGSDARVRAGRCYSALISQADPDVFAGDSVAQYCIASEPNLGTFSNSSNSSGAWITSFPFCFRMNFTVRVVCFLAVGTHCTRLHLCGTPHLLSMMLPTLRMCSRFTAPIPLCAACRLLVLTRTQGAISNVSGYDLLVQNLCVVGGSLAPQYAADATAVFLPWLEIQSGPKTTSLPSI